MLLSNHLPAIGRALTVVCLLAVTAVAQAQQASAAGNAIPVEDFFKRSAFGSPKLSPKGTHVAYTRELKGRLNLVVMDVQTRKATAITGEDDKDVVFFEWVNSNRLIYSFANVGASDAEQRPEGVYAINIDGTEQRTLSENTLLTAGSRLTGTERALPPRSVFHSRARSGDPDDIIAAQFADSPPRVSLFRANTKTGRSTPLTSGGPVNVIRWALDWNDIPRAAVSISGGLTSLWGRDSAASPWRKVEEHAVHEGGRAIYPVDFDKAGNLHVATSVNSDTAAIYRFDWDKGRPETDFLVSLKDFDIDKGLIFSAATGRIVGVRYQALQEGTFWLDKNLKAIQETVDNTLPGRVNRVTFATDGIDGAVDQRVALVESYADVSPGRVLLFDIAKNRLTQIGQSKPWIDEKRAAQADIIRYSARDGLSIPAVLTLPRGAVAKNLPLVVMPHGGPYVRGLYWAWHPAPQFLASRGYAVLEPDFRGSTGHGWKHFRAGWKQWGLSMQDDLADGVAHLVKQGVVDPQRVCIAGASYGGYATVMGLIRHPEVYKCGVSWVGVTDIELLYTVGWSDTADSEWARYGMPVLVGDREKDKAQLRETSAVTQAARLKRPLILAYGTVDVRVPYDHGRQLRSAMKDGAELEYIEYQGEGHGWRKLSTNVDFWTRVESFLHKHIGKQ